MCRSRNRWIESKIVRKRQDDIDGKCKDTIGLYTKPCNEALDNNNMCLNNTNSRQI